MEQSGEEWLSWRRTVLTSTDAFKIWQGKPKDLMEVWERLNGIGDDILPNDAMLHGRRMEPVARDFFCKLKGDVYWPDVVESERYPFLGASLDGINFSKSHILEIKCPYSSNMLQKARDGIIDERYIIQMTHQQLATEIPRSWFFVYENDEHYHCIEYEALEEMKQELLEKLRDFWDKHIVTKKPPIQEREDPEWLQLEEMYWHYKENAKWNEKAAEETLKKLKELSGNSSAYGPSLMLTKYPRKGSVNYGKIPELSGVDLEKYRKDSTICWRAEKR